MENSPSVQQQLIQLRQLEEAAQLRFTEAKNQLLALRRKIRELQKLLAPPTN